MCNCVHMLGKFQDRETMSNLESNLVLSYTCRPVSQSFPEMKSTSATGGGDGQGGCGWPGGGGVLFEVEDVSLAEFM